MATWIDPTVDVKLEIAFSTDPLATTPTYTDVTAYLRRDGVTISRGTTSEDSSIGPGFATFMLDNRDRRFDPDYSSGAYYPNVLPMRRVRLTVTKSAAVVVFTGFVMSWQNDWTLDDGVSIVRCVDSMWWLGNQLLAGSAYEALVVSDGPIHYWPLQSGTDAIDLVGDLSMTLQPARIVRQASLTSTQYVTLRDINTIDEAAPLGGGTYMNGVDGTNGIVSAPPKCIEAWIDIVPGEITNGKAVVWADGTTNSPNYDLLRLEAAGGVWSIGYGSDVDNQHRVIGTTGINVEGGLQHVVVYVSGGSVFLRINGQPVWSEALSAGHGLPGGFKTQISAFSFTDGEYGAAISHVAVYDTTPSTATLDAHYRAGLDAFGDPGSRDRGGARIGRVLDEIGWSSSLRSLDTGNFGHGPYLPAGQQAVDYIRSVVDVERGLFFCDRSGNLAFVDLAASVGGSATGKVFSDDGGAGAIKYTQPFTMSPASVDTVRNVVTVSYSDVGAITRRDATSEATYGSSQLFIDGPTLAKARDASSIAAWELAQRKDPSTRVESITVLWRNGTATDTTNAIDTCSAVELGDVVTVEITPRGVGSQVVKTCQVVGIEHEITKEHGVTTLYMRPAYDQSGWFTLGTSALGGTDVLLP